MLKADLHLHTNYSSDCLTKIEKVITQCQKKRVNCIAVTDHNEIRGAFEIQELAPFKVIIGEEIRTQEGEIIGYFLSQHIKPGMSAKETVYQIKNQGGLVCVPHPFDRMRKSKLNFQALEQILPDVDIVEVFNARNLYTADNASAERFAAKHNLLTSLGTDAHWPWEIGGAHMLIPDFDDVVGFRKGLESIQGNSTWQKTKSGLLPHIGTKGFKLLNKFIDKRS